MPLGEDWNSPAAEREPIMASFGSLRLALLFGAGAVALALLVAPFAENRSRHELARNGDHVDRMATGSVPGGRSYTVRRSVLQTNPNSVCIIRPNGSRSGDC
jgi:hypothetical protein